MENIFVEFLPPWVETGLQPAFYDKESGSVLQQTARMYARVNMLIRMFNKLSKNTKDEVERFEGVVNDEIEDFEHDTTETVDEYIEKFNQLHDYVYDYFDNLDVQEEINNKLDAMAEAGTLQSIIYDYLNSIALFCFDTVSDMKSATNLINGSYAYTLGFYAKNDGGGAMYKIRTKTVDDTPNDLNLIAIGDTLVAEINEFSAINVKQLGAYGDDTHDDSTAISIALNNYNHITFDNGIFNITSPVTMTRSHVKIDGTNATLKISTTGHGLIMDNLTDVEISNLIITAPTQYSDMSGGDTHRMLNISNSTYINIHNCEISYGLMGATFTSCSDVNFNYNHVHHFKAWGCFIGYDQTSAKNFTVTHNQCHNGDYDGIKLSGYIENIIITENTCHTHVRDGIDFAGHTANKIEIANNVLYGNTLNGIDFKTLTRETYPFDESFTKIFENINFHDNVISKNGEHNINVQVYYTDLHPNNFIMDNNNIEIRTTTSSQSGSGIRIGGWVSDLTDSLVIKNNVIKSTSSDCYDYGMRLNSCSHVLVIDNIVDGYFRSSIYLDKTDDSFNLSNTNNTIVNNRISNLKSSSCITIQGTADVTYLDAHNNTLKNNNASYLISNELFSESTNTIGINYYDGYYTATPTHRTTKCVVYPAADPITAGCFGWIGYQSNSGARYYQYLPISA